MKAQPGQLVVERIGDAEINHHADLPVENVLAAMPGIDVWPMCSARRASGLAVSRSCVSARPRSA
jgi:hypothetical protein